MFLVFFLCLCRTLYAQLNHCVTAFGKRLLRTWVARPLYHIESIKERQDAVAGLKVRLASPHMTFGTLLIFLFTCGFYVFMIT